MRLPLTDPRDIVPFPLDINNTGQITGIYWFEDSEYAFISDNKGNMENLGSLGGLHSSGNAINDAGQVTGYSEPSFPYPGIPDEFAEPYHAFFYNRGRMQDLFSLVWHSEGLGINGAGQVTGFSYKNGARYGFLYSSSNGETQDLGHLGGGATTGEAINDAGQVVGRSRTALGVFHAFLYSNGQIRDLNDLIPFDSGWVLVSAIGISNTGYITGRGSLNGQPHGFLLDPSIQLELMDAAGEPTSRKLITDLTANRYIAATGGMVTEQHVADYHRAGVGVENPARRIGFVADGNARLLVRAQPDPDLNNTGGVHQYIKFSIASGANTRVYFENSQAGSDGPLIRSTASTSQSILLSTTTVDPSTSLQQATAVLVAEEQYSGAANEREYDPLKVRNCYCLPMARGSSTPVSPVHGQVDAGIAECRRHWHLRYAAVRNGHLRTEECTETFGMRAFSQLGL